MKKIKNFIKENYKWLIIYIVTFLVLTYHLPYYLARPGGLIDVSKRIEIDDAYKVDGSFNLAYVSISKVNIVDYLLSYIINDWELIKKEDINVNHESDDETAFRDKLDLEEANQTAIILAYNKALKEVKINDNKLYVTYVDSLAKTDLKIKDEIISINGIDIKNKSDISKIIDNLNVGDKVDVEVINDGKHYIKTAEIINFENFKILGIMMGSIKDYQVSPDIKLKFTDSESGPSGGLMMTLAIYNYLTKEDLTKGKKIAGTGTIDEDGQVGMIDGVKYKIMGAVKAKADIFFVPTLNYEEAIKVKKEKNYDIDIVKVDTLDEAIAYLKRQ